MEKRESFHFSQLESVLYLKRQGAALHLNYLQTVPPLPVKTYGNGIQVYSYLRYSWALPNPKMSFKEEMQTSQSAERYSESCS